MLRRRTFLSLAAALALRPRPAAAARADGGPRHPFGSRPRRYARGTILPTGERAALNAAVTAFYDQWKARYLKPGCTPGRAYVTTDARGGGMSAQSITVSEAHGYGMVITALMAGHDPQARQSFDALHRFFREHPSRQSPDLMAWNQLQGCVTDPKDGDNTATDGDLDIAYGLLLADRQWGSGGEIAYAAEAKKVIAAVAAHELNPRTHLTVLGSWVAPSNDAKWINATRTSDFMMDHFRAYGAATGDRRWARVVDAHYRLIAAVQARFAAPTGLVPDFVVDASTPAAARPAPPDFLEGKKDGLYGANACRVPFRLGIDYLMHGDRRARAVLAPLNAFFRKTTADDPATIDDGYHLDGRRFTPDLRNRMSYVAPLGVSAMIDARNQPWLDRLWQVVNGRPLEGEGYFANTLKMLALITMSGNWWSP